MKKYFESHVSASKGAKGAPEVSLRRERQVGVESMEAGATVPHSNTTESSARPAGLVRTYETVDANDLLKHVGRSQPSSETVDPASAERSSLHLNETTGSGAGARGYETSIRASVASSEASEVYANPVGQASIENSAAEVWSIASESVALGGNNDDNASTTSVDSVELELREFLMNEAKSCCAAGDWKGAEDIIQELLDSPSLGPHQRGKLTLMLGSVLDEQGKSAEVLTLLDGVTFAAEEAGSAEYFIAKAYFDLGQPAKSKDSCLKAIKLLKNNKTGTTRTSEYRAFELMIALLESMGKKGEARFYKSKLPSGYVPREVFRVTRTSSSAPALKKSQPDLPEQPAAGGTTRTEGRKSGSFNEPSKPVLPDFDSLKISENAADTLKQFQIFFDTGGSSLRGSEKMIMAAWEHAMRDASQGDLARLLLEKSNIATIKLDGIVFNHGLVGTALHFAAKYNRADFIPALLDRGANIHAVANFLHKHHKDPRRGSTMANYYGDEQLRGVQAIHVAARAGSTDAIKVLRRYFGVSATATDWDDKVPLHHAVKSGSFAAASCFLTQESYEAREVRFGMTSLHYAIQAGHSNDMAKFLLSKGARMEVVDNLGMTPLHYAARYNNVEMVKYLVQRGADINARDKHDRTPYRIAAAYDRTGEIGRHLVITPKPLAPPGFSTTTATRVLYARALINYTPRPGEGELAFRKGDIIEIEPKYQDWWNGFLRGQKGLFPLSYVEVTKLPAQPDQIYTNAFHRRAIFPPNKRKN